jgi:hypothetical protein
VGLIVVCGEGIKDQTFKEWNKKLVWPKMKPKEKKGKGLWP